MNNEANLKNKDQSFIGPSSVKMLKYNGGSNYIAHSEQISLRHPGST